MQYPHPYGNTASSVITNGGSAVGERLCDNFYRIVAINILIRF